MPPFHLARCLFCAATALACAPAWADDAYQVFVHPRSAYRIAYPPGFVAQTAPADGDAQVFLAPDGGAELRVASSACPQPQGNAAAFLAGFAKQEQAHQLVVTYRAQGKGFAVVSGLAGDRVFYKKLLTDEHRCAQFSFDYDSADSKHYDPMVARVAKSFQH